MTWEKLDLQVNIAHDLINCPTITNNTPTLKIIIEIYYHLLLLLLLVFVLVYFILIINLLKNILFNLLPIIEIILNPFQLAFLNINLSIQYSVIPIPIAKW